MSEIEFDVTVGLCAWHLRGRADADPTGAVAAIREAIERLPGANWIDVEFWGPCSATANWVQVYPRGRCFTPDGSSWRRLKDDVERLALAAIG